MEQKLSKRFVMCYVFIVTCLLDQITKLIFSHRDFFIGSIHFHLVKNFGLAFSLSFGWLLNLILIISGVIFFIYYYFNQQEKLSKFDQLGFAFIFSGAISNIIDRIYFGFVRDFIDVRLGFTFNLADAFVVMGLIVMLVYMGGDKTAN